MEVTVPLKQKKVFCQNFRIVIQSIISGRVTRRERTQTYKGQEASKSKPRLRKTQLRVAPWPSPQN